MEKSATKTKKSLSQISFPNGDIQSHNSSSDKNLKRDHDGATLSPEGIFSLLFVEMMLIKIKLSLSLLASCFSLL